MTQHVAITSTRVSRLNPSATVALTDRAKELKSQGRDIVSMSAGEPDFSTPGVVVDAAVRALNDGFTHYAPSTGLPELRRLISLKLKEENGIPPVGADNVLVLPGAKAGVMFACLALLQAGDECLCPEPAWVSYRECVSFCDASYVPVPMSGDNGFKLDLQSLDRAVSDRTKLIIINSPANPTGKVWSREELEAVAAIAAKRDIIVLSDEIYEDLVFEGARHVSFASLPGMAERTLTLNGFSKAYAMTGWRLGYISGPGHLIKAMLKIQQHSTTCAASFVQKAGIAALKHAREDVRSMVEVFESRRSLLVEGLASVPGVRVEAPAGTFYLFLDIRSWGLPSQGAALRLLDEVGLAATPGSAFGESGEGYLRLSFAASDKDIEECCRRLKSFAESI